MFLLIVVCVGKVVQRYVEQTPDRRRFDVVPYRVLDFWILEQLD